MVDFSRCPKCKVLYDLRKIDLSFSEGWVQCGQCSKKFIAFVHVVEYEEVQSHDLEAPLSEANAVEAENQRQPQQNADTEQELVDQEEYEEDDNFYSEEFSEMVGSLLTSEAVAESMSVLEGERSLKKKRSGYVESLTEFSDDLIDIQPTEPEGTIFSEFEESKSAKNKAIKIKTVRIISFVFLLALFSCLIALLSVQLHSRGNYRWISSLKYERLISIFPYLTYFERKQLDLSKLHLASTWMEPIEGKSNERRIVLQLVNTSNINQIYPDLQLELKDNKGQVVARRLIYPNMYLQPGHLGILDSKAAVTIFIHLTAYPINATGGYKLDLVSKVIRK